MVAAYMQPGFEFFFVYFIHDLHTRPLKEHRIPEPRFEYFDDTAKRQKNRASKI